MNTQIVIDHLEQGLPMNARLKREIVRRLRSYKFNEDCANSSLQLQLAESEQRVKELKDVLKDIAWRMTRQEDEIIGVVRKALEDTK